MDSALENVGEVLLFSGLPTVLLILAAGWWGLNKILEPVTVLTKAAERIHGHNLKERLPSSGAGDELDHFTQVFNSMVERLDESFSAMRSFTLHASHELKTPLTIMRANLETSMKRCPPGGDQVEMLANLMDEVQRLTKIVDGLSFLAKADNGQIAFEWEMVRLDELVRESYEDALIMAQENGVRVEMPVCDPISVRGDRHRLRQMLLNLTENAIKYNRPGGHVAIRLHQGAETADLSIANTGPGIPTDSLPRIFDRFYRGEGGRSPNQEGCGLGLSIVDWIAQAHQAVVEVRSDPRTTTVFAFKFPLAAEESSDGTAAGAA